MLRQSILASRKSASVYPIMSRKTWLASTIWLQLAVTMPMMFEFLQPLELGLALPPRVLSLLARGYVQDCANHALGATRTVAEEPGMDGNPT